jgi:spoIIIJ-associated protein
MTSIEQTGRTVEDAVKTALKLLGATREEVEVEVLSQETRGLLGILGYSEAKVRVTRKHAPPEPEEAEPSAPEQEEEFGPMEVSEAEVALELSSPPAPREVENPSPLALRARDLLARILTEMDMGAHVEITEEEEDAVYLTIRDGEDLGLLIGKRGQTLAALQLLVAMISNRPLPQEERKRLILDAADYRARRERALISMARQAADRAKRSGRDVPLEALNPRERRIVHVTLADDSAVTTRSEGEEPDRFVVVVPKRRRESGPRAR